jgi:hypothetical protein
LVFLNETSSHLLSQYNVNLNLNLNVGYNLPLDILTNLLKNLENNKSVENIEDDDVLGQNLKVIESNIQELVKMLSMLIKQECAVNIKDEKILELRNNINSLSVERYNY